MQIKVSPKPAEALARHLTDYIVSNSSATILCFLAGGSALEIFNYLELSPENKRRTIFCMGDERVSGESDFNNYLQLQSKLSAEQQDLDIIDTSCSNSETPKIFAKRINELISKIIFESEKVKIISILGIGSDGHTAGIFPMSKESFISTYTADSTYVPVTGHDLTIDSRASLTPAWILEQADQVLGYAETESKCDHILQELVKRNYEINEMPAQIIKLHKNGFLFTDCIKLEAN